MPAGEPSEQKWISVAAVLCVLLLLFWASPYWTHWQYMPGQARSVQGFDGRRYNVHLTHSDPSAAADQLAYLHRQSIELLAALRRKYKPLDPGFGEPDPLRLETANSFPSRREVVSRLLQRYDRDRLVESSPINPGGDTSYTLGKGTMLALCLREKDPTLIGDPSIHDLHEPTILWFVTVHELTHMGLDATGHPPEFWSCFKFLLQECELAGLAPPDGWPDYARFPVDYCGLTVDYNPIYDAHLQVLV